MTNKSLALFLFVLMVSVVGLAKPTDSLRVELRGGKKFIIHRVTKGETLAAIASKYGIEEADITNNNALITAGVMVGQIIKVPVNESRYGIVEVKPIVALTESRMPLAKTLPPPIAIKASNQQTVSSDPTPEKEIKVETPESKNTALPVKDTLFPTLEATTEPVKIKRRMTDKFQSYVVASPQTVNQLANSFDVDVNDLIAFNNLKNYRLKEGQKIKIPVYENVPVAVANVPVKPVPLPVAQTPAVKPVLINREVSRPSVILPPIIKADTLMVKTDTLVVVKSDTLKKETMPKISNPVAVVKMLPKKTTPSVITIKAEEEKKVVKPEETLAQNMVLDSTYMVDTAYHSYRTLATLRGLPESMINKFDSAYIHPDNIYYKINDYKRQDYFYDAWAIKAANANARNVNTTNQRQGAGDKNFTHTVKPGETIQSIAKKYKISVSDIANWNGLFQYRVRVGQDLTVNATRADLNEFEKAEVGNQDKLNGTIIKEDVKVGLAFYNPKAPLKGVYCNDVVKGKIIYILNRENFEEYYGRVVGPLPKNVPANTILQIDSEVAKKLHINNPIANIEIWYGVIE